MKNFKFITIVVLLQTTAYCRATISLEFERIPDGPSPRGPPQQNGPQQNGQNNIQHSSSQNQPQYSSPNINSNYPPQSFSPSGASSNPHYSIQPSVYNTPNNYQFTGPSNNQGQYSQQQQQFSSPSSSGGHYTGGQYYQPTSNNPIQYPQQQQYQQQQQQYQQQQQQQQQQQNRHQPVASASGQHPFSHPNSITGGTDPANKPSPSGRPASFMSLLLGSMGLHGLGNGIFGRLRGPKPPPRNNNNNNNPHHHNNNNNNNQNHQQQQQHQQKPTFVHGGPDHGSTSTNQVHFGNHQTAVQNYAQQQHYQVAQQQQLHQQQQQQQQQHQQQISYPQTSPSTPLLAASNLDSVKKPDEYILSTTQSYYEPPSHHQHDQHVHSSSSSSSLSSNHGLDSGSHYEPQYQSSSHVISSGPSSLKYEEPPSSVSYREESHDIKPYTIIEKPVVHYIEKPVVRFVEKTVVRTVEKPVIRVVEKPVIKYIEKPRGFLGKQGDPYIAESTSFGGGGERETVEGESDIHVIHHDYPPQHTPTAHHAEDTEYYSGIDGTYFRKGNESPKSIGIKTAATEAPEDNAFKQIVQIPKDLPAYTPTGYRVVQTHVYGPTVSGDGLKLTPFSGAGHKIGDSDGESSNVHHSTSEIKSRVDNHHNHHQHGKKSSVKLTEQFLS